MSNEHIFSSSSICTSIPANLNNFIGIMVERTQLLSFVSHNLLKKNLRTTCCHQERSIILPSQNLNLSVLPSVPINEQYGQADRFPRRRKLLPTQTQSLFLTHVRAYYKYDINPASFIKDFPLKRWIPYYYSMRISRLMQTMLFRNFFNFLFSSLIIFRFCGRSFYLFSFVFSLSGASLPLTLPHLFFFSTNYKNTHVCEKKNLDLPRLRLKYSSALSLFLSFLRFSTLTLNFISYLCPINK